MTKIPSSDLDVFCPLCHAEPQHPCHTRSGEPIGSTHSARWRAARYLDRHYPDALIIDAEIVCIPPEPIMRPNRVEWRTQLGLTVALTCAGVSVDTAHGQFQLIGPISPQDTDDLLTAIAAAKTSRAHDSIPAPAETTRVR